MTDTAQSAPAAQSTLAGKVAIVTGAGQGVGMSIARVLSRRGVNLVITGRTPSKLDALCDELRAEGRKVESAPGDVGLRADVDRAVALAVETFGGLDILINNAQALLSTDFDESVLDITAENLEIPFRSGLVGTLNCMQACYPHLKARGGGSIVNFGSTTAIAGMSGFGSYSITKEAIRGLTRAAATEWGPDNIRVNVVLPSALTDRLREMVETNREIMEQSIAVIPLRRIGDTELDIGAAVAALVGDDMRFVTGATIMLDGGARYIY
jgi:NAD(P)-dependent dehydrogenase (short-subunit alcohol dehydrogenase family)